MYIDMCRQTTNIDKCSKIVRVLIYIHTRLIYASTLHLNIYIYMSIYIYVYDIKSQVRS